LNGFSVMASVGGGVAIGATGVGAGKSGGE
jgi:hypothetical protein